MATGVRSPRWASFAGAAAWFAWTALALGTSYAIVPLFSSNQNHHFLIGLARAGDGWLRDDWLAGTADPFPLFTAYVAYVHRHLVDAVHYLVYYALFGAYGYGLIRIVEHARPPQPATATAERLTFLAGLCLLHSEAAGYLLGIDLSHIQWWQLSHWGVAEQEIFGHGAFQASSFGMLLPLAMASCLWGQPLVAALLAGSVLMVHFSYALTVGPLIVAFMIVAGRRSPKALGLGRVAAVAAIALAFALPAAADVLLRLGPTSREASTAAAGILVQHLPQETLISHWFGWRALAQIALMIAGIWLSADTDLTPMLAIPFVAGVGLTLVQAGTRSAQMALLFPWRVSVLLVPVSTALVLRRFVGRAFAAGAAWRKPTVRASAALVAASILVGAIRMTLQAAYFYDSRPLTKMADRVVPTRWREDFKHNLRPDTLAVMRFVRAGAKKGDLYVTPPELERFRLVAGAPILADFKSHPYRDVEVIEWRRRLDLVEDVFASRDACASLDAIRASYPVTHLVADDRIRPLSCSGWAKTYTDDTFDIYRALDIR